LQNVIEIPSFYHQQWAPQYPLVVIFAYNGCNYPIKVRKYHNKYFFAEGLKQFRKELNIHEGITITYIASDKNWISNVHFMPPLHYQTYGRPPITKRTYVWTVDVSQAMISAPYSLVKLHSIIKHYHFYYP